MASDACEWVQDFDGNWETGCGGLFVISEGTPTENEFRFCCYCGKPLTEVPYADPPDEDDDNGK